MATQFRSFRSPLQDLFPSLSQALIQAAGPFLLALAVVSAVSPALVAQTPTPVPVLTWRYDLTHSGANTQETALTPAIVASTSFGKLFSIKLDDYVFAQPLYVPNLTMSDGQAHNVLFVATENDTIYAFDADTKGNPIWQITLLDTAHGAASGATPKPQADVAPSQDIGPHIGITGTPAIDPATRTMYVVSNTKESGQYFSRLHAIDIVTGAEKFGGPVEIKATVAGTGDGSSGGQVSFDPLWSNQRPALDLYNGHVYIGYSSHGDISPYHGWLFAYDASTLKQTAVICLSPNDYGASLWGAGAGLPIDTKTGRMYVVTGNGHHTTQFQAGSSYGESVVGFNLANGQLTPTDSWTAFDYQNLNTQDWDQGSGGLLMLPDQPGAHPHQLITAGKEGRLTVLDRDNLGGFASGASSNTNALQDFQISGIPVGEGFWSTAAYWNENVYTWAGGDDGGTPNKGMHFTIGGDGTLNPTRKSETTFTSGFPGVTFSVSSNGTQGGIVWGVKVDQFNSWGPAVLYAFDADDLTNVLYESDTNATRDSGGASNKFAVPVVTNGKVYVAEHGQLDVYGILNGTPVAAAPTISPNGGSFSSAQKVTLSSSTPSAEIHYTLDGSTPTSSSTLYSAPFTISSTTTVKAITTAPGYTQSAVSSATFTITIPPPPAVTFSPAAGTYTGTQSVTLADSDANAKIYYTTDGSTPSASSTAYTAPISVAASETLKAIAIDPSSGSSSVASAAYVIQAPANPSFTLSGSAISSLTAGSSGTSTITITPSGGFTGTVALTCAITSSPSQAANVPTCSATQPAAISGSQAVTATLTVGTTAGLTPSAKNSGLAFGGGTALAALILFGLPRRRRRWQAILGLLLFAIFTTAATGCTNGINIKQKGTTPGSYVVTVTGTSGSLSSTTTVGVTVQ